MLPHSLLAVTVHRPAAVALVAWASQTPVSGLLQQAAVALRRTDGWSVSVAESAHPRRGRAVLLLPPIFESTEAVGGTLQARLHVLSHSEHVCA